jgi:hypothetical protein
MSGILSTIDPRTFAAGLAMLATTAALIGWQLRGDPSRCRSWLGYGALFLELLAAGLALSWAVMQGEGMLAVLFGLGFVGLALSKATTAGALVHSYRTGNGAAVFVGLVTLLGVYVIVYLAGVFGGQHDTVTKTAAAALASSPVQAVDAQLSAARERLAGLAGFADSTRAADETAAADSAAASIEAERRRLSSELGAARGELSACPKDHITRCIKPAQAKIEGLRAELATLPVATGSDYAEQHAAYTGLQQHIADLETKRAELLSDGGMATTAAAGSDDRMITWLTGFEGEHAAGLKWLLFVLAFDLLSLGLRIFSELHGGHDDAAAAVAQFRALLLAGFDRGAAAAILGGNSQTIPPAQVRLNEPVPQMAVGGAVLSDGLIHAHAGERVLNAQETAEWEALKAADRAADKEAREWADNSKYFDEYYARDGRVRTAAQYQDWLSKKPNSTTPQQRECRHCFSGYMCQKYGEVDGHKTDYWNNPGGCKHFWLRDGTKQPELHAIANDYKAMTKGNDYKPMTTQANDLLANDYKPMTTKANGLQLIACESCGVEVKQRTVWQRFCPTCSAERKKGVLRAKSKTKK